MATESTGGGWAISRLDEILPPARPRPTAEEEQAAEEPLPEPLPERVSKVRHEATSATTDRSTRTMALVVACHAARLTLGQTLTAARQHAPTRARFGRGDDLDLGGLRTDVRRCWAKLGDGQAEEHEPDEPVGDSWRPVDLGPYVTGEAVQAVPTMLTRTDGEPLLYPGKIHGLQAEPESAKSWMAELACVQQMQAGAHVLYIDLEDTAATAVERLRALGVADEVIVEQFHYVAPDEPIGFEVRAVIVETLETFPISLCIIDGITEALALCGLKSTDNDDVARFLRRLPKLIARRGIAVVMLDHVAKDKLTRGTWALGAQHKRAGIDVSVSLEVVPGAPFGRGREGTARVTITKDKHGFLGASPSAGRRGARSCSPRPPTTEPRCRRSSVHPRASTAHRGARPSSWRSSAGRSSCSTSP